MTKVYVTHESLNFDYTPAEVYGDIDFLTATDLSVHHNSPSNRTTVDGIRKKLEGFTQDDYLLPSGSPIITGLAMAILHERFEKINVLKWSKMYQNYSSMVVQFDYNK